jgi:hypothetical protein
MCHDIFWRWRIPLRLFVAVLEKAIDQVSQH